MACSSHHMSWSQFCHWAIKGMVISEIQTDTVYMKTVIATHHSSSPQEVFMVA